MREWLRRIRGALGMGLTWAVVWAIVGGGVMETVVDPHRKILDMWPQTLAIPGFLSGVVFAVVLWISEGRRRFDELSLPRFTALGAMGGLLLGALLVAAGLGRTAVPDLWLRAAFFIAPPTVLSALSAFVTLKLARMPAKREQLPASSDVGEIETTSRSDH